MPNDEIDVWVSWMLAEELWKINHKAVPNPHSLTTHRGNKSAYTRGSFELGLHKNGINAICICNWQFIAFRTLIYRCWIYKGPRPGLLITCMPASPCTLAWGCDTWKTNNKAKFEPTGFMVALRRLVCSLANKKWRTKTAEPFDQSLTEAITTHANQSEVTNWGHPIWSAHYALCAYGPHTWNSFSLWSTIAINRALVDARVAYGLSTAKQDHDINAR